MKNFTVLIIVAVMLVLSACSSGDGEAKENKVTKQLIIPKSNHYEHLYISGVNEEGIASADTKIIHSDIATVKDVLAMLDRLVVKKPKYENEIESVKQLDHQGSYIIAFGDTKDFRGETYTIYMMKNGDFYYQDTLGSKDMMYVTIEEHKDILEKIKSKLGVNF